MGMCDEFRKISRMPLFRPVEPGGSAPRDSGPFGLWPIFFASFQTDRRVGGTFGRPGIAGVGITKGASGLPRYRQVGRHSPRCWRGCYHRGVRPGVATAGF